MRTNPNACRPIEVGSFDAVAKKDDSLDSYVKDGFLHRAFELQ